MAIIVSHSHFIHATCVSGLVCQTFDPIILDRLSFPGTKCFQSGTRWKYKAYKWYAVRKSLGTAALQRKYNKAAFRLYTGKNSKSALSLYNKSTFCLSSRKQLNYLLFVESRGTLDDANRRRSNRNDSRTDRNSEWKTSKLW